MSFQWLKKAQIKPGVTFALAFVALVAAGCGANNVTPVYPPPGAGNGNYYGSYGAGCSIGISYPLEGNGQPYVGQLSSYNGAFTGSSVTMTLGYMTAPSASYQFQNIIGSGHLQLSNMNTGIPGLNLSAVPLCSSDPTTGAVAPGNFASQDQSIAITLKGLIPNSFYQSGVGVGGSQAPQVAVQIGYQGGAWIYPTKFKGSVDIMIIYYDPIFMTPQVQTLQMYAQ